MLAHRSVKRNFKCKISSYISHQFIFNKGTKITQWEKGQGLFKNCCFCVCVCGYPTGSVPFVEKGILFCMSKSISKFQKRKNHKDYVSLSAHFSPLWLMSEAGPRGACSYLRITSGPVLSLHNAVPGSCHSDIKQRAITDCLYATGKKRRGY